MKKQFVCPLCGANVSADSSYVGRKVRCPKCQQTFVLSDSVDTGDDEEIGFKDSEPKKNPTVQPAGNISIKRSAASNGAPNFGADTGRNGVYNSNPNNVSGNGPIGNIQNGTSLPGNVSEETPAFVPGSNLNDLQNLVQQQNRAEAKSNVSIPRKGVTSTESIEEDEEDRPRPRTNAKKYYGEISPREARNSFLGTVCVWICCFITFLIVASIFQKNPAALKIVLMIGGITMFGMNIYLVIKYFKLCKSIWGTSNAIIFLILGGIPLVTLVVLVMALFKSFESDSPKSSGGKTSYLYDSIPVKKKKSVFKKPSFYITIAAVFLGINVLFFLLVVAVQAQKNRRSQNRPAATAFRNEFRQIEKQTEEMKNKTSNIKMPGMAMPEPPNIPKVINSERKPTKMTIPASPMASGAINLPADDPAMKKDFELPEVNEKNYPNLKYAIVEGSVDISKIYDFFQSTARQNDRNGDGFLDAEELNSMQMGPQKYFIYADHQKEKEKRKAGKTEILPKDRDRAESSASGLAAGSGDGKATVKRSGTNTRSEKINLVIPLNKKPAIFIRAEKKYSIADLEKRNVPEYALKAARDADQLGDKDGYLNKKENFDFNRLCNEAFFNELKKQNSKPE